MPRRSVRTTLLEHALQRAADDGELMRLLLGDDPTEYDLNASDMSSNYSLSNHAMSINPGSSIPSVSSISSISSVSSVSSVSSPSSVDSNMDPPWDDYGLDFAPNEVDMELLDMFADTDADVRDLLEALTNERILFPGDPIPKLSQIYLILNQYRYSHIELFWLNLRVTPETFDHLLSLICDDPIFHNNSNRPQTPPNIQLAITLYRFGHFGNAASVKSIAQWAGISSGLVVLATRRVMIALARLHDLAFAAPTESEIADAKAWVASQSCEAWSPGWLMVDGTLVPLAWKPGYFGEAFFDRKSNYSLNVQVSLAQLCISIILIFLNHAPLYAYS